MKMLGNKLRFVARWSRALPFALLFWAGPAFARPEYAEGIQKQLDLDCTPPCWLCHATANGGDTPNKPFALSMVRAGLTAKGPEAAIQAILDAKGTAMDVDSDGDGKNDAQELKDQTNPNIHPDNGDETLSCGPAYGCGARVAPSSKVDGTAMVGAFAAAALLVAFGRRRRST